MSRDNIRNFTYLNVEGRWRGHHWDGLALDADGALRLSTVPLLEGVPPAELPTQPHPGGPAGIAVDLDGTIYLSDPVANRVLRIDGCDASRAPAPCMGGEGTTPGKFRTPRGLLLQRRRRVLFVADSGNHRIELFDSGTSQMLDIWSADPMSDAPQPSSVPGGFDTPWTLAGDSSGNIFVLDYGNKRVQKFDALGQVVPSFWATLSAAGIITQPVDVAVSEFGGNTRIYIVDAPAHAIFVVDTTGAPVLGKDGHPISFGGNLLAEPLGIVSRAEALYVGDNARRAVLEFSLDEFRFVGEAIGYRGPVAGMAIDATGTLLVHSGDLSSSPVRLLPDKGYRKQGIFWTDAIAAPGDKVVWHRLNAIGAIPAPGSHLQLYWHISSDPRDAPVPPSLGSSNPFSDPKWQAGPPDVPDVFLGGNPSFYIWVGALLSGDGLTSPVIEQLRLEFDHAGYMAYLPSIYQKPGACKDFLPRFLSLFETFFGETESAISALPSLFDPWSAPKSCLPWLAGWLGMTLDEGWDEGTQRRAIAEAFAGYAWRGTPAGLQQALLRRAGVVAVVQEPLLGASWWALPAPAAQPCSSQDDASSQPTQWTAAKNSMLGYTTMLAPAEPQGSVVGTTAVLDQSHLISGEDFGTPLFSDVAFRFSVQVYRAQVNSAQALEKVRAVIGEEKPAHTAYHLCVLEPRWRVGFQSRLGIDTIVGGPPESLRLGERGQLGANATLSGPPAVALGQGSKVGVGTFVG